MKRLKILIAEDEEFYSQAYFEALKGNFDVDVVKNGEEGILACKENSYDVIIIDLIMPIKSGKKMLEAIDAKNARVIVLTTLEGDTDREDSLALGADLFLVKAETPPNILIETIKELTKA